MSDSHPRRRIDDPHVLKALTHPLRQRLYRLLAQLGPGTVGSLAERVEADSGQVSYHLRQLAKGGFIEHAPELARDRRETWWRIVPGSTTWAREDFTTPEGQAIFETVHAQTVSDQFDRLQRFTESLEEWDKEWQRASVNNQSYLFLTPQELHELLGELRPIFERWAQVSQRAREAGETKGREPIFTFLHAFPDRP